MRLGQGDLVEQALSFPFESILDVGAGDLSASLEFSKAEKKVTATGYDFSSYGVQEFMDGVELHEGVDVCQMDCFEAGQFDAIWCAHVLEHVPNTGLALQEMWRILKPGGYLFLSVPEYSPFVVGGHINTGWNLGTLMYVLILNGFDVRNGSFINHCWNLAAFVQKASAPKLDLRHDKGDIECLREYFPEKIEVRQGFYGEIDRINWNWAFRPHGQAERRFRKSCRRKQIHGLLPPLVRNYFRSFKF